MAFEHLWFSSRHFFFDWMSKTWKDFDYLQDVKADVERCWSAEETIVEESLEHHRASFSFKVNFYQRVSNQVANKSWISVRVRHFFFDWMLKTWKDFDYLQDVKANVERCWSEEETIVEESLKNPQTSFDFKANFLKEYRTK